MNEPVRVACVQAEPVILDREATLDKLAALDRRGEGERRAARRLPGDVHPRLPELRVGEVPRRLGRPAGEGRFAQLAARVASRCPAPAADRLGEIAQEHEVWLVTGVNERDPDRTSTLYNALLYHAPDGTLALHHRKLVPTNHERLIWGQGDGGGLRALPTEHRPDRRPDLLGELHAARALRAVRVRRRDLHRLDRRRRRRLAGDPGPHRARVARVRGRAVATSSAAASYPEDFPLARRDCRDRLRSAAAARRSSLPDGSYLAGPLYDEEGILYADLEPQRLDEERQRFDPAGHYHRPDVLELKVTPRKGAR